MELFEMKAATIVLLSAIVCYSNQQPFDGYGDAPPPPHMYPTDPSNPNQVDPNNMGPPPQSDNSGASDFVPTWPTQPSGDHYVSNGMMSPSDSSWSDLAAPQDWSVTSDTPTMAPFSP